MALRFGKLRHAIKGRSATRLVVLEMLRRIYDGFDIVIFHISMGDADSRRSLVVGNLILYFI